MAPLFQQPFMSGGFPSMNRAAGPFNISNLTVSDGFDISGFDTTGARGVFLKSDGTKFFTVSLTTDEVNEWALSVAWDITSASHTTQDDVSAQAGTPNGIYIKPDGTKYYITDFTNQSVYQYSMSTAWDMSTGSYDSKSKAVGVSPRSLFFKSDGTKMYVCDDTNDEVKEWSLSTPWDVSTASAGSSFSVLSQTGTPNGMTILSDGEILLVVGVNENKIFQYNLSSAWDVTSATYSGNSFSLSSETSAPSGLTIANSDAKVYVVDNTNQKVWEYDV